jgi:hypothetical protein
MCGQDSRRLVLKERRNRRVGAMMKARERASDSIVHKIKINRMDRIDRIKN